MEKTRTLRTEEVNELLALLADHNRRTVIEYFRDSGATVASLDDLVREVSDCGHGRTDTTRVILHHSTLPKLDDAGVVDYDADRRVVRYRGNRDLEAILSELEAARSRD